MPNQPSLDPETLKKKRLSTADMIANGILLVPMVAFFIFADETWAWRIISHDLTNLKTFGYIVLIVIVFHVIRKIISAVVYGIMCAGDNN